MGFLLKNVNSVLKVMKSEPVGREQGKVGIQYDVSTSGFLCLREALQHRTLSFSVTGRSAELNRWKRGLGFVSFCIPFVFLTVLSTVLLYRISSILDLVSPSYVPPNYRYPHLSICLVRIFPSGSVIFILR